MLGAKVEVEKAHRIEKKQGGSFVVTKLRIWEQKREVMIKKNKLKGKQLYTDDLTVKERAIQKEIRDIAKKEREQGTETKVGYRKLKVENKVFKWKEGGSFKEIKFWSRQNLVDNQNE